MKKRILAALMIGVLACTVMPVSASELTDINKAGDTAVEAEIIDDTPDTGEVSYIISIPEKIDFGTLTMPENNEEAHPKTVTFEVSAVEINNLDTTTSRIAVLMRDSAAEAGSFKIQGVSETNASKLLEYTVFTAAGSDITTGNEYTNGYLLTAFSEAGQSTTGTLSLEQNQLLSDMKIANWAGNYLGTINFYTTIANLGYYN